MCYKEFVILVAIGLSVMVVTDTRLLAGQSAVLSEQDAVATALSYVGRESTDKQRSLSSSGADPVLFTDSLTPFLTKLADCKSAWKVSVTGMTLSPLRADPGKSNGQMDVYLDSLTGSFLKAVIHLADLDAVDDPILQASDAENQLTDLGEGYISIPQTPPAISLMQALESSPYNAYKSKEIVAQYVLFTYRYNAGSDSLPPRPVWILNLRGTPPQQGIGGSVDFLPVYNRNRLRIVVDATTGKPIMSTTTPSVPLTPEDRKRIFGE